MKMKEMGCAVEPIQVLEKLFFTNKRVKQLMFLNQFNLKKIYDNLVSTDPANPAPVQTTAAAKNRGKAGLNRKNSSNKYLVA